MIVTTQKGIFADILKAIEDAGGAIFIRDIELSRAEMDEFLHTVPRERVGQYYGTEEIPQLLNIKHNRNEVVSELYYSGVRIFCADRDAVDD